MTRPIRHTLHASRPAGRRPLLVASWMLMAVLAGDGPPCNGQTTEPFAELIAAARGVEAFLADDENLVYDMPEDWEALHEGLARRDRERIRERFQRDVMREVMRVIEGDLVDDDTKNTELAVRIGLAQSGCVRFRRKSLEDYVDDEMELTPESSTALDTRLARVAARAREAQDRLDAPDTIDLFEGDDNSLVLRRVTGPQVDAFYAMATPCTYATVRILDADRPSEDENEHVKALMKRFNTRVSYDDAQEFAEVLTKRSGVRRLVLPTQGQARAIGETEPTEEEAGASGETELAIWTETPWDWPNSPEERKAALRYGVTMMTVADLGHKLGPDDMIGELPFARRDELGFQLVASQQDVRRRWLDQVENRVLKVERQRAQEEKKRKAAEEAKRQQQAKEEAEAEKQEEEEAEAEKQEEERAPAEPEEQKEMQEKDQPEPQAKEDGDQPAPNEVPEEQEQADDQENTDPNQQPKEPEPAETEE